jgi:dipeptidyl aminopeptidase/acylaminoacyl peptidase
MYARALVLVLIAAVPLMAQPQAATKPFTIRDLVTLQRLSDPQLSPDGTRVVYTLRSTDMENDRGLTDIWMARTDGSGNPQRLTSHPASDTSPRWAPDGRSIYFLSSRGGSSQVWRLPLEGGEALQVTREPRSVDSFVVSRDGSRLAISMKVFPGSTPAETAKRLADTAARKATGRIYDNLPVRHWDTWLDGTRSHVFVVPSGGGQAVSVMRDLDADSPSRPFGGAEEYTFTPDGRSVVFTAKDAGREEMWSTNHDLWIAPADGSADPRNLTADNPAWDSHPIFSPDGNWLAWLAMERPGYESDRWRIMVRRWPDGAAREVAASWDRSPSHLAWSPDSRTLWADAQNLGHVSLFAIDVATGRVRSVIEQGRIVGFSPGRDRIVFAMSHLRSPAQLFSARLDGSDRRMLADPNREALAQTAWGEPEQFTFKGANDATVYGWVVKPAHFEAGRKYPIAFLIHGGPQGSFGNDFHYRWNPQVWAGAGYAAVMIDFHGSTGYGQAFTDAIRNDWGGKPLEDLQKGLEAAIARYPWLDGDRAAALGGSYGGYMVNWIAGMWPDRFRAHVVHSGNLDEQLAYYMTEELWFPEWEHGGVPWESVEGYTKHSPMNLVDRWKTPTLVIHGALDYRVVDTQGLATFTALQRRGVPSRLLFYPDENHWILRPSNSILWYDTVIEWLDRWVKGTPAKDGGPGLSGGH